MSQQLTPPDVNLYDPDKGTVDWELYSVGRQRYPDKLYQAIFEYHRGDWEKVIDFGAGDCTSSLSLLQRFKHIEATDLAEDQLKLGLARLRGRGIGEDKLTTRVCSAGQHPGVDATADMVTASTCIHWFDVEAFMADAARLLKPGGTLAIWTGSNAPFFLDVVDGVAKVSALTDIYGDWFKAGPGKRYIEFNRAIAYRYNLDNVGIPSPPFVDETRYNWHPPQGIPNMDKLYFHDRSMIAVSPSAKIIDDIPALPSECAVYRDDFTFADLDNYILTLAHPEKGKRWIDTKEYQEMRAKMVEVAGGEEVKLTAVFPLALILARKKEE